MFRERGCTGCVKSVCKILERLTATLNRGAAQIAAIDHAGPAPTDDIDHGTWQPNIWNQIDIATYACNPLGLSRSFGEGVFEG